MDNRTCNVCGVEYPLDKQHFRWKVLDGKGFFTAECLHCRAKAKLSNRERKKAKREASLKRIEEAGVDLFLGSTATGGSNIPHSAEVIERVFQYFGGVAGLWTQNYSFESWAAYFKPLGLHIYLFQPI